MIRRPVLVLLMAAAIVPGSAPASFAQSAQPSAAPPPAAAAAPPAIYRPPLRGAPGGRVGGASRSALVPAEPLPVISLFAPADHTGLTASSEPSLYFFISRGSRWPTELAIAAPGQAAPVLDTRIPTPTAAGIYALPLARYHVHLQPGVIYTWSVSVVLDPHAWSRNIVASATIMFEPQQAARPGPGIAPAQRVAELAGAGLWYDAIAAAIADEDRDGHVAVDALLHQVGLDAAAAYDRQAATPPPARP